MIRPRLSIAAALFCCCLFAGSAFAQQASEADAQAIRAKLDSLRAAVDELRKLTAAEKHIPDVEIHAKGAEWILRHGEFIRPDYARWTLEALDAGLARAAAARQGMAAWEASAGRKTLAYRSAVDESVQPYGLLLPLEFGKDPERRWPLHVVLHGRDANLTEISFIHANSGRAAPAEQDWIQLDIYGRTNNAYRWAGETDVFEALADVKRRFRIDDRRIVLHGFSMGGAGSWHLGMHHPSQWCSVGPGAGFVDFYKYQKAAKTLPAWQDRTLHIYDAIDYALNAFDVPVCTYGGELDPQLLASTEMVAAAEKVGVPIKLIVGPQTEHRFHPESQKEFMAWHHERQVAGRRAWSDLREIRFVTHTLKFNTCDWLTIEEQIEPYKASVVEAKVNDATGLLVVKTQNVGLLQLARDVAEEVDLDGTRLPLLKGAGGLLPGVYYEGGPGAWRMLGYETSLAFPKNSDLRKRHNVQGPIDDAFMQPFVCVRGTGTAWNEAQAAWAGWTLERFASEFDKWMRAKVPVVDDKDVTAEMIQSKSLILFGDPGSNSTLAKVLTQLPVKWSKESLEVNGEKYDTATHGLSLIYPNPMNPRRYVVVNSGHTFHAADFRNSNAWLFPRLGDIAVQRFAKADGGYKEEIVWADLFDSGWKLSKGAK